jgi:phage terminase large subunit
MQPKIELPAKLVPVFTGEADVRGAYGGRGSAKTRSFAKMTAVKAVMWDAAGREGQILCARQFMNSLAESSLEEIKAAIRETDWLLPFFDIGEKYIKTKSGRIYYSFAGLDRNVDSIKSKARILLCWVDEAEPVTEEAWIKLIPTLREVDSELWVTWNPESKRSPVHNRFRMSQDPRYKIVEMNWRDNPWFPSILNRQRLRDKNERPDYYPHIWEGEMLLIKEGAYFAKQLQQAKDDGRIKPLARNPLYRLRAFWDLGGRGAKADATTIVIAEWRSEEVYVLDYYEAKGQTVGAHVHWLQRKGYETALCYLPHDGEPRSPIADASWKTFLEAAGFDVEIVPNQGAGAAMMRVEAARLHFPRIHFDEKKTEALREALGYYHPKIDEKRGIDLGPEHDDSSHAADAFGMMCQVYEPPRNTVEEYEVNTDWVV